MKFIRTDKNILKATDSRGSSGRLSQGFTLIEVLTALAIASVLIGALVGLLMGGSNIIRVLNDRKNAGLERAVAGLEHMAREIQASPVYPSIAFEGSADRVTFPELIAFKDKGEVWNDFHLGRVTQATFGQSFEIKPVKYFFDPSKKALVRQVADADPDVVVDGLEGVRFSYATRSDPEASWSWADKTPTGESGRLGAVRARFVFDPKKYHYTIPGIQKTFFVVRRHPLNAVLDESEKEKDPTP